jgi:hypothetical protein
VFGIRLAAHRPRVHTVQMTDRRVLRALLLVAMLIGTAAHAQTGAIHGKVVDQNGRPAESANISTKLRVSWISVAARASAIGMTHFSSRDFRVSKRRSTSPVYKPDGARAESR